jgi:AraC-like DNA-binding protein
MFEYTIIEGGLDCAHSYTEDIPSFDFHLHNKYEIYLLLSGDVHYFVERKKYILKKGDILIFNSKEIHKPTFVGASPYERIIIHFNPQIAAYFSTPDINLLGCFENRKNGENNLINLEQGKHTLFCSLLDRLAQLCSKVDESPIDKLSILLQVFSILDKNTKEIKLDINQQTQQPQQLKSPISQVITYINNHLTEELSLDVLEKKSFLNKNYLCKLFKDQMGSTIHSYILVRRISLAKQILENGASVTEACNQSGFNDYANFIRLFKKITGTSPAKFKVHAFGKI